MKKLLLISLIFFSSLSFADGDSIWTRSAAAGNLPAWFSPTGNAERGLAYGLVGGMDRLFVVSRTSALSVKVLNALTGADVSSLSVEGIAGGTFPLNDISVSEDGVIFASNLVITAGDSLKIYKWISESAQPVKVFDDLVTGNGKRLGDKFSLNGKVSDNSIRLYFADATNHRVFVFGTTNNGASFSVVDSVQFPSGTMGSSPHVLFIDDAYAINSNGRNLTVWDEMGNLFGTIPSNVIPTGSNAMVHVVDQVTEINYVSVYHYGAGNENARVLDASGDEFEFVRIYKNTMSLGSNANANGVGDIDVKANSDGTFILYILGTNNGIGAYHFKFEPIINGMFNEHYTLTASKQNNNFGFGPNIDVSGLYYYVRENNLYIGVRGFLDRTTNNGIALFLGLSNLNGTGRPAGTPMGGVPNGGHLFGNTDNPNWAMNFETHFAFVINPGNSDSVIYMDAVNYTTPTQAQYIGMAYQGGTPATGPSVPGIFSQNSITFAYDSAYGMGRGWEMAIPLSEIGNPNPTHTIRMFGVVSSATAYFSDVTVPGNITSGNPGFNVNFNTLAGGPYSSSEFPIPVELLSFSAFSYGNSILLEWTTATEINNSGFEIERSSDKIIFEKIGFVKGAGNSTELNSYSYKDENLTAGKYYYRLRQIDFDGTINYSNIIEANAPVIPDEFILTQNYPNPFNPSTKIRFVTGSSAALTLKIYNTLGEEVAELFNSAAEAGKLYEIEFSSSNLNGMKNLPSGVYFYQLKQGERVETKKMVLLK
jgi:hypothetical protein